MNDIVNDKKGHNIVNDKIAALLINRTAYLLPVCLLFNSIFWHVDGFHFEVSWYYVLLNIYIQTVLKSYIFKIFQQKVINKFMQLRENTGNSISVAMWPALM